MKILFHVPHLNTIYAGRTIYQGYKDAFTDLGHQFRYLTADDNQKLVFDNYAPDVLFAGLSSYTLKYLDLNAVKECKKRGMKVFINVPFWVSPMSKTRINETPSLSTNQNFINLIKSGNYGDVYYNVCEQNDPRMGGFEKVTGYKYYTIPLAANKKMHFYEYSEKFRSDISFLGTNLPEKERFFKEVIQPLKNKYNVKFFGQDWTFLDKFLGSSQKLGHFFNVPYLKSIQKPKLDLSDERKIYSSAIISLNVHEDYQRKFGSDCNERTFKIPLCGGFEITDDVACIRKYFRDGEEIVIAKDKKDWLEKINFYVSNPEKRGKIIEAGMARVLADHTYHNRVQELVGIYYGNK